MTDVLGTLGALNKRLGRNLSDAERSLYLRVFDEMEFRDDEEGMTEKEYQVFLQALPADHRKRLESEFSFEQEAGDDGKIDIDEFSGMLDKLSGAQAAGQRASANAL